MCPPFSPYGTIAAFGVLAVFILEQAVHSLFRAVASDQKGQVRPIDR